ncbi:MULTISPECIES: hypothetical protein [unclassified Streptomyces]|uniref:hypothetical protein n=1 Tax=unclassified Streptomyces TaxID=2593676 RepID=UPI00224F6964|nr:hypothetical protein [Streptomyces sp. NBC_00047]MCX5613411.1 hypothetical protein [Streptomyces sp. NBC_00047]
MSGDFTQEWGSERARAAGQAAMRLNGVPAADGGGGGGGTFTSTPAQKRSAANTIETELEPNTKKATEYADESTDTAVKGFDGWDAAAGLKKAADTWDQQVKVLMGRLGSEKGSLRGASGLFVQNDLGTGDGFRPLGTQSKLNGL